MSLTIDSSPGSVNDMTSTSPFAPPSVLPGFVVATHVAVELGLDWLGLPATQRAAARRLHATLQIFGAYTHWPVSDLPDRLGYPTPTQAERSMLTSQYTQSMIDAADGIDLYLRMLDRLPSRRSTLVAARLLADTHREIFVDVGDRHPIGETVTSCRAIAGVVQTLMCNADMYISDALAAIKAGQSTGQLELADIEPRSAFDALNSMAPGVSTAEQRSRQTTFEWRARSRSRR